MTTKTTNPIILANEKETVEFRPAGVTVEVVRKSPFMRFGLKMHVPTEEARKEYARLLATGYWRW